MVTIMIRCPTTGQAISTGRKVASIEAFRSSPVFFGRTYCPHCRLMHEWFAKNAWVGSGNANVEIAGVPLT
ncbi:MAG: hypothetical protein KGQ47_01730 [Hyphomicrobiales bacterium]|nr:hypothetical protein [Hyphomicrobiales bacterium]